MLRDRKIAVFIDVDNSALDNDRYARIMNQIRAMGEIVCASVYNASERKHKLVIEDARQHGYALVVPASGRRRSRKAFDSRIYVDVATLVARNMLVDTVAIISAPTTDLLYLFSHLRRLGLQIIAGNDLDEQSAALVSERLDLGHPRPVLKPAARPAPARPAARPAASRPAPARPSAPARHDESDSGRTAELLRQIERLREDYETTSHRSSAARARSAARSSEPSIADETRDLISKLSTYQDQPSETEHVDGPHAVYVSQNDSDLIKKIEELRREHAVHESEELVAEIKKLLDELE